MALQRRQEGRWISGWKCNDVNLFDHKMRHAVLKKKTVGATAVRHRFTLSFRGVNAAIKWGNGIANKSVLPEPSEAQKVACFNNNISGPTPLDGYLRVRR